MSTLNNDVLSVIASNLVDPDLAAFACVCGQTRDVVATMDRPFSKLEYAGQVNTRISFDDRDFKYEFKIIRCFGPRLVEFRQRIGCISHLVGVLISNRNGDYVLGGHRFKVEKIYDAERERIANAFRRAEGFRGSALHKYWLKDSDYYN